MCVEWFLNILLTPLLHYTDRKVLYQTVIEHLWMTVRANSCVFLRWEMEMGANSCMRKSHT